ncbi:MAG: hypothetical protein WD557_03665 [Dehalococcoidia bacterium]
MSTRESLHALIDRLTDDELEELSERLDVAAWEQTPEDELEADEIAGMLEGRAEHERGETVRGTDLFRRLQL